MSALIYWFRNDLRLADSPALTHAIALAKAQGRPLLPVFCHPAPAATRWGFARVGVHRQRYLRATLDDLTDQLRARGSQLLELHGASAATLIALCQGLGVNQIVCEDIAAPHEQAQVAALRASGLIVDCVWQSSLFDPAQLPFAPRDLPDVFTPFRQRVEKAGLRPPAPLPAPTHLPAPPVLHGAKIALFLEQNMPLTQSGHALSAMNHENADNPSSYPYHTPAFAGGECAALAHLQRYLATQQVNTYKATRNQLSGTGFSSKFSPWLASGALSVRRIDAELRAYEAEHGANEGTDWLRFELLWRDYFRLLHLKYGARLYRAQGLRTTPRAPATADATRLARWCQGDTGTPLVDAAMRELRATGYLSNRLRQVVASFWLHECHGDWRAGAAWFESQLLDYDVYSNTGNWLYIAGLGTDPRGGRRFDLAKQAREHDPHGSYQRLWLD